MSTVGTVVDLVDHTFFRIERAAEVTNVIQCAWVYDRPVAIDGLRRFHHHLQRGRLARRIERSPLPFGRPRWVSPWQQNQLEIAEERCPRADFDTWLARQADTPLDAEHGPGWHLAVVPFSDGGAGVSLVASHCLTDAVGLCEALADAAQGRDLPRRWPAAGSRPRPQALREDVWQTVRDVPAIGKAAAVAAQFAWRNRRDGGQVATPTGPSARITIPTATAFVDADQWDSRAGDLGGTSNTLLVAVAARMAQRMGRTTADGAVAVTMAVSQRAPGDTRANAITNVDFTVNPTHAATDLREIRTATKQALIRCAEQPEQRWRLLPLVPVIPERLGRRWVDAAATSAVSVGASNVGIIDPAVNRPDGTDADHFAMRSLTAHATTAMTDRSGGLLSVLSGRVRGTVFVSVVSYQRDGRNSNSFVNGLVSDVLSEFALSTTTGWPVQERILGR